MKNHKVLFILALLLFTAAGCANTSATPVQTATENIYSEPLVFDMTDTVCTLDDFLTQSANHPDSNIVWSVPFSFGSISSDVSTLIVTNLSDFDVTLIDYLPNLSYLDLTGCHNWEYVLQIMETYPALEIHYCVPLGELFLPQTSDQEITISDPDVNQLIRNLPYLPHISKVNLTGNLPSIDLLIALKQSFPQITFVWNFDFLGIPVTTLTESVDLSGIPLDGTEELESLLPCFYQLTTVDMCNCGLSNETMALLNDRYDRTEFIWEVKIGSIVTRTDAIYFMPAKYGVSWMRQEQTENLKYLTKLQVLDLGHFEGIHDISFLYYMPDLQVLSLNSGTFTDFSPIGACQKLEFFEVFLGTGTDLWPLVNCTSLKNLNISYMPYGDPLPLCQMTWLDRLWIAGSKLSNAEKTMIQQSLPNTMTVFNSSSSTAKGWRHSPSYYTARDIVEMGYLSQ